MSKEKLLLTIRKLKKEEVPDLQRLETLIFGEGWSIESLQNDMENENSCYLGAFHNGKLVGYMAAWFIVDEAHINAMGIDTGFQGYGIGKMLVWKMLQIAQKNGCRWATLEVNEKNIPARKLYEMFGFKCISRRKDYYKKGEDALIMWIRNIQWKPRFKLMEKIRKEWERKLCLSSE